MQKNVRKTHKNTPKKHVFPVSLHHEPAVKIIIFLQFRDIFTIFVGSPSRIFRKITVLSSVLSSIRGNSVKRLFTFDNFDWSGRFSAPKLLFFTSSSEFPKNRSFEHCFEQHYEAIRQQSCSLLMILTGPDDFQLQNQYFSRRAPNCLVYLIEAVQKLKISVFHEVPRMSRFFVIFLRFL